MKSQIVYITLFLASFFFSCGNKEASVVAENEQNNEFITVTKAQFENEKMQLGKLSQQAFEQSINVTGMIDVPPQNKASISSFMGGYVVKTPLLVGDRVKKGQLLVTLENTEFVELQQQYLEVAEQLSFLKNEYDRQKTLYDENISSQKSFLKAESNYKSSLALYNGLKKKLQMLNINPKKVEQGDFTSTINIYAPIEANVSKVNVSNGSFVSPADVIMELVDTDHVHLELSVFEQDIMNINKGQKIKFKIPEASNEVFNAEVHLVGTTIDEVTRRVNVHGHLEDENHSFIVGMFVDANIITGSVENKSLPNSAVVEYVGNNYVLVKEEENENGYAFIKIPIEIGVSNEISTPILNYETLEGKTILIKGAGDLLKE